MNRIEPAMGTPQSIEEKEIEARSLLPLPMEVRVLVWQYLGKVPVCPEHLLELDQEVSKNRVWTLNVDDWKTIPAINSFIQKCQLDAGNQWETLAPGTKLEHLYQKLTSELGELDPEMLRGFNPSQNYLDPKLYVRLAWQIREIEGKNEWNAQLPVGQSWNLNWF